MKARQQQQEARREANALSVTEGRADEEAPQYPEISG